MSKEEGHPLENKRRNNLSKFSDPLGTGALDIPRPLTKLYLNGFILINSITFLFSAKNLFNFIQKNEFLYYIIKDSFFYSTIVYRNQRILCHRNNPIYKSKNFL